jgi:hypothetical protein
MYAESSVDRTVKDKNIETIQQGKHFITDIIDTYMRLISSECSNDILDINCGWLMQISFVNSNPESPQRNIYKLVRKRAFVDYQIADGSTEKRVK